MFTAWVLATPRQRPACRLPELSDVAQLSHGLPPRFAKCRLTRYLSFQIRENQRISSLFRRKASVRKCFQPVSTNGARAAVYSAFKHKGQSILSLLFCPGVRTESVGCVCRSKPRIVADGRNTARVDQCSGVSVPLLETGRNRDHARRSWLRVLSIHTDSCSRKLPRCKRLLRSVTCQLGSVVGIMVTPLPQPCPSISAWCKGSCRRLEGACGGTVRAVTASQTLSAATTPSYNKWSQFVDQRHRQFAFAFVGRRLRFGKECASRSVECAHTQRLNRARHAQFTPKAKTTSIKYGTALQITTVCLHVTSVSVNKPSAAAKQRH